MTLSIEDDGPVRTILLNRPEAMNALSLQLRWDLCDAIQAARSDDSVRVIIMSGAGTRAFCVGLDLKELAARGDASAVLGAEIFDDDVVASVEQCEKPVIGAINGPAIAGGLELALGCDILIAAEQASFAAPGCLTLPIDAIRSSASPGAAGMRFARRCSRGDDGSPRRSQIGCRTRSARCWHARPN